jgi:hypothetical protein
VQADEFGWGIWAYGLDDTCELVAKHQRQAYAAEQNAGHDERIVMAETGSFDPHERFSIRWLRHGTLFASQDETITGCF